MVKLMLDTLSTQEIRVGLIIDGKKLNLRRRIDKQKAQVLLSLIDEILRAGEISLKEIDEIEVKTGPGSFTGLRVGVSVANTLGFLLDIPVNGNPPGQFVVPVYG